MYIIGAKLIHIDMGSYFICAYLCRLVFLTSLLTAPSILSHGPLPWDIAKKCNSALSEKSSSWWDRLINFFCFYTGLLIRQKNTWFFQGVVETVLSHSLSVFEKSKKMLYCVPLSHSSCKSFYFSITCPLCSMSRKDVVLPGPYTNDAIGLRPAARRSFRKNPRWQYNLHFSMFLSLI